MPTIEDKEYKYLKEMERLHLELMHNFINPPLVLNRIDPPEFQNLKNELSKYKKLFWKIYIKEDKKDE